jgi:hypothetical protein
VCVGMSERQVEGPKEATRRRPPPGTICSGLDNPAMAHAVSPTLMHRTVYEHSSGGEQKLSEAKKKRMEVEHGGTTRRVALMLWGTGRISVSYARARLIHPGPILLPCLYW